jgi:hypothetical protein
MSDTTSTNSIDLSSVWKGVQEIQSQATEGFLREEDAERAVDIYEEYASRHPSCKVRAAASGADRRMTVLEISGGDVKITRQTTASHYSNRTGICVEFDYYADNERDLHEELKEEGFSAHSKRKIIEKSAGTNEVQRDIDLSNEPSEETLVSLFKINKHARKYADKAQHHYHRQKHNSAGRNSSRKKALYTVKSAVLSKIADEADQIEQHIIDGKKYACLYFGEHSFHGKESELNLSSEDYDTDDPKALDDFKKDSDTGDISRSLKASLIHINETFGVNANSHLDPDTIGGYFVGWSYLG